METGHAHAHAHAPAPAPACATPASVAPAIPAPHPPPAPAPTDLDRRAARLLRCYPSAWRARYGDEFTELLLADLQEDPRSPRRTADVLRAALEARLTATGLTGQTLDPADQARRALASLGCAMAGFLVLGATMWSQLTVGWQWSAPDTLGTTMATVVLSVVLGAFAVLALAAAVPVVWNVAVRLARRQTRGLIRPVLLSVAGTAVLVGGSRHFANGWPGTGGHPWAHQGLIPAGVAAFSWAATLSVTAYWAHPGALASFPTAEVVWMAASPVAMGCLVVGLTKTLHRLDLSPRVLRFESRVGRCATVAMVALLFGCGCWVFDGGPGPRDLFHVGAVDLVGLGVMGVALAVAVRAGQRAGSAALAHPVR